MVAMLVCEGCGDRVGLDAEMFAYDRSPEGQGRMRWMTLCASCGEEYMLVLWRVSESSGDPVRARARVLAGGAA